MKIHSKVPSCTNRVNCMLSRFSHVQLCATPWTVAHKAPLSIGFSRQDYWSGLSWPPPGEVFPTQGLDPCLLGLLYWQMGSLPGKRKVSPGKPTKMNVTPMNVKVEVNFSDVSSPPETSLLVYRTRTPEEGTITRPVPGVIFSPVLQPSCLPAVKTDNYRLRI